MMHAVPMAHPIVTTVLLAAAVATVLLSCLGMLVMHGPFNKLHYLGPATLVAPVLVAAAMLVEKPWSPATFKVAGVAVLLLIESPIMAHVIGRAARLRTQGDLEITDGEREGK